MTEDEKAIVMALAEVWKMYLTLPSQHTYDATEFMHGIHQLQEKVASRPAWRELGEAP